MTYGNNGVLVVIEVAESKPVDLGLEMLALARQLADNLGGDVTAVAFGAGLENIGEKLIAHGADQVLVNDNAIFDNFHAEAWLPDLTKIISEVAPDVVLIGHSEPGTDLAPRLAFRLDVDVATGCESIEIIDGQPNMTRSCFGGLAREVITFSKKPVLATIRSKTQQALEPMVERVGEIQIVNSVLDENSIRTRLVSREKEKADGDLDWCPRSYQIGLSGRTVAPELYLAVGISGASHHMAGCGNSKTIVSVNTDPKAEIFKSSRFGIVGNSQEIMPALAEEIRKLKA